MKLSDVVPTVASQQLPTVLGEQSLLENGIMIRSLNLGDDVTDTPLQKRSRPPRRKPTSFVDYKVERTRLNNGRPIDHRFEMKAAHKEAVLHAYRWWAKLFSSGGQGIKGGLQWVWAHLGHGKTAAKRREAARHSFQKAKESKRQASISWEEMIAFVKEEIAHERFVKAEKRARRRKRT